MGYLVDLSVEWQLFKSSGRAINNIVNLDNISKIAKNFRKTGKEVVIKLESEVLLEGVLSKEFVLENLNPLLKLLRESNVTCRWLMLHRLSLKPEFRNFVSKNAKLTSILKILLFGSQFEQILEKIIIQLLFQKDEYWESDRSAAVDNMSDVSDLYSGKTSFKLIKANQQYSDWFGRMRDNITNLDVEKQGESSRRIQKFVRALIDVEKYDGIDDNMQVRQYITSTIGHLKKMLKVLNLRKRLPTEIKQITDASYTSLLLKEYVVQMQNIIQKDSKSTLLLRSTFMKLISIMISPMSRIMQLSELPEEEKERNFEEEKKSVSMYYSAELMKFVKEVLQIIPNRVFKVSLEMSSYLTSKIKNMPGLIEQRELRDFAQFENRLR